MRRGLESRHKANRLVAARNYQALFRGEDSVEADVAAMRLDTCIERLIAFVEAHATKE